MPPSSHEDLLILQLSCSPTELPRTVGWAGFLHAPSISKGAAPQAAIEGGGSGMWSFCRGSLPRPLEWLFSLGLRHRYFILPTGKTLDLKQSEEQEKMRSAPCPQLTRHLGRWFCALLASQQLGGGLVWCLPPSILSISTNTRGRCQQRLPAPSETLSTPHSTCAPLDGQPGDALEPVWLLGHSKGTAGPKVPGRVGQGAGDRHLMRIWEHLQPQKLGMLWRVERAQVLGQLGKENPSAAPPSPFWAPGLCLHPYQLPAGAHNPLPILGSTDAVATPGILDTASVSAEQAVLEIGGVAQHPGRRRVGSYQWHLLVLRVKERKRPGSLGAHLEKQCISHVVHCKNVLRGCFSCLGTWCIMVPHLQSRKQDSQELTDGKHMFPCWRGRRGKKSLAAEGKAGQRGSQGRVWGTDMADPSRQGGSER